MNAVRSAVASNAVPCLQIRSVGSHSTSIREKEVKDGKGMDRVCQGVVLPPKKEF